MGIGVEVAPGGGEVGVKVAVGMGVNVDVVWKT